MTQDVICSRVRAVVDSLVQTGTEGISLITDQSNLDAVIKDKIPYGLMYCLSNAASDMLDGAIEQLDLSGTEYTGNNAGNIINSGRVWKVKLPEDTLRVMSARLSSWMSTPTPVDESSAVAMMQLDEYARGSWDRPVTVIRRDGGDLWLEFYSGRGKESASDIRISLIKTPDLSNVTSTTEISVPAKLEGAFIYYVAALAMTAFREDISSTLFSIANQQLGIVNNRQEEQ